MFAVPPLRHVTCLVLLLCGRLVYALDWRPVDPADLAAKTSAIEPNADVEGLFWDVRLHDENINGEWLTIWDYYNRVKVFTTRGRDRFRSIEIQEPPRVKVSDIHARVLNPNGTIVSLRPEDIHEGLLAGIRRVKIKVKSFAIPGIDVGSIIEWRYRRDEERPALLYRRLALQADYPVREITYYVKPYVSPRALVVMRGQQFNIAQPELTLQRDGYERIVERNVPAYRKEPFMPPPNESEGWMLIYYQRTDRPQGDAFWNELAADFYRTFQARMKAGGEVKRTASEVIAAGRTDDEKLRALYDFCRLHIRNTGTDAVSAEERADAKKNQNPSDTINQRLGTPDDVQFAFAALATAAGYDARLALIAPRDGGVFRHQFADPYFLSGRAIAVRSGSSWKFFVPSVPYLPFGMLPPAYEGGVALIADPKEAHFLTLPVTRPAANFLQESAALTLSDDGALDGDFVMQYSGVPGTIRKEAAAKRSEAELLDEYQEIIKRQFPGSDISDVKIENASDPEKPITYRFHLHSAAYGQHTGKRIFFQPNVFRRGAKPIFSGEQRTHPIWFPYAWSEEQQVTINLPEGFVLENPDIPRSVKFGDAGEYVVKAQIRNGHQLTYKRQFTWGDKGLITLPAQSYAAVKQVFDNVAIGDTRVMTLKLEDTSKPVAGSEN